MRIGDDVRVPRDKNLALGRYPTIIEHFNFAEELLGVYDTAGADDGAHAKENARRNVVGDELNALMKNRVAGIASAVVPQNVGVFLCLAQKVGDLALSAVSVLEVYDYVNV